MKAWILTFANFKKNGVRVTFEDMSPVLVEQLNMIRNFCADYNVVSLGLPYLCTACSKTSLHTISAEEVKRSQFQLKSLPCPHCKSSSEFDDVAEEYFEFLKH